MQDAELYCYLLGLKPPWKVERVSPSPLSGQEMPLFKVKFEPAFNDFTVPVTMSKKRGSESRYKPRSLFDSC